MTTASFALRHEQVEQIRALAAEMRVSQSELMRQAVDLFLREMVREALEELARLRTASHPVTGTDAIPEPGDRRR